MKLRMLLALALLPLPGAAFGATAAEDIAAVEAQFEAGLAARDVKLLDALLARPFTWVHSSDGRVDDREGWLAGAARGMALAGQHRDRSEHGATLQLHGDPPHTAVRVSRVRLADAERESWIRQTHTWVRNAAGKWQLAMGQGVVMYDGPLLDAALPARYAGVYLLQDGRRLLLDWQDGMLLATLPNGAQAQVFLATPTDEVVRNPAAGSLHFTLDEHGVPSHASLMRANQEVWRAARKQQ